MTPGSTKSPTLLSYEATARWNDQADPSKTLCATVYVKRAMMWRVAFHQQTAAIEIQGVERP
jgi:hypothetical protein